MVKITQELLDKMADTYINMKGRLSIEEVALMYGSSKTTLVRYFNGDGVVSLDNERQKLVDDVKEYNYYVGKTTNGNEGHRKLDDKEIVLLAKKMVEEKLTLDDFEEASKSTLYNLFNKKILGEELYNEVISQYNENKRNAFKSNK